MDWLLLSFCASKLLLKMLIPSAVCLSTGLCYTKFLYLHFMVGILIFPEIGHVLSLVFIQNKGWTSELNFLFQG